MSNPVKSPAPDSTRNAHRLDRADRRLATILAAAALALYLRTLAPDVLPGDPGEFQAAAWRLGLAHPTGYPLYLLLGSAVQHLLAWVGIRPAAALNGLSALLGALAVALLYLLVLRWTVGPVLVRRLAGVYSAVLLAVNLTFWSQALIAEVYTLHTLLMLALLLAAQQVIPARPGAPSPAVTGRGLILLAGLAGLSLTHHGMSLLLFPPLALYLALAGRGWRALPAHTWPAVAAAFLLPLLLYLYIPLRSGPDASPWYHQRLGDGVLQLYTNDWASFVAFMTGRSIGAGFRDLTDALAQLPQAAFLWRYHFGWAGLLMMGLGLFWLARWQAWPILALTGAYLLLQQLFVLFYDIGDILVYYIPLYLVGAVWAGFGLLGLASARWRRPASDDGSDGLEVAPAALLPAPLAGLIAGALLLWTLRDVAATAERIDQSESYTARTQWETILAAQPPAGAILVSNDRNEIVPLFYLQAVEGRGQGLTGLFPQIAPNVRFADIGATLDTALAAGGQQPVYLIKPMPGLEVKFALAPATPPLVRVDGPAHVLQSGPPAYPLDHALGPLRLVGIDLELAPGQATVRPHWLVETPLDGDYTATVQLLDAAGNRLAQDDHPAGGVYYPTSLWKPGEHLVETHRLALSGPPPAGATLLLGMYREPALSPLAPPIQVPLPP
ncbi:MAG TPA: DUF2723 domain-containing protein [Caldilineaceae bacterium]|nr:DUF2723 domain-containing protein [Caldilineaceae bacterium]